MQVQKLRKEPLDAASCLEKLEHLKEKYASFLRDNKTFGDDVEHLRKCLAEAEIMATRASALRCRAAFHASIRLLEDLAEERQQVYDQIMPSMSATIISGMEAVQRSMADFEMKKDFEKTLSALL